MEMQIKGEQESWGQNKVPLSAHAWQSSPAARGRELCAGIIVLLHYSKQFFFFLPVLGWFWELLCKCSVTLGWLQLGKSPLLPLWSYHEVHGAAGAKEIKSSTDKLLMALK